MFFVVLTIFSFLTLQYRRAFSHTPSKCVDNALKNHYINSSKTPINKDKNIYKKRVCNQQEIS